MRLDTWHGQVMAYAAELHSRLGAIMTTWEAAR